VNYVIFDLEFNQPFKINKVTKQLEKGNVRINLPQEIIEIGAVKTDENLNILDTFRIFVKPQVYIYLHPKVSKITKIKREDLEYAFPFEQCIKHFRKWIGEDYVLCSWGTDDIREMMRNCCYHSIEIGWMDNFINAQKLYSIFSNLDANKQVSLKNTIKELKIQTKESTHRALNDSHYTLEIMRRFDNDLIKNNIEKASSYEPIQFDYLTDKRIDRRKLRRRCPDCGKFITAESSWLKIHKGIQSVGHCKNCNKHVLCKFMISINKNDRVICYPENKIITEYGFNFLKEQFTQRVV
jgi:inhibitor of KinA sporulation pathway (predicted exonuclease)